MKRRFIEAVAMLLVAAGATLTAGQLANQDTRLIAAARAGDQATVTRLVREGVDVNATEGDGSTALLWAAYRMDTAMASALIAAGADVNAANRFEMAPLLMAARFADDAMVKLLLEAGADPHRVYGEGETALMAAAGAGSLPAVRLLLAAGVPVNARETAYQQTALMWAAEGGHVEVVRALLDAGADVNAVARPSSLSRMRGDGGRMWVDWSSGGLTAVMFAARQGHLDVIRLLTDRGAAVRLANPDGITAMMMAVLNDRIDAAALLLEKGANPDDGSLLEAVRLHNLRTNETVGEATRPRPDHPNDLTPLDLITRLIEAGADPHRVATHTLHLDGTGQPGPVNESAMARAIAAQDVAAVRIMLSSGASPNEPNPDGATPLHLAAGGGGGGRGGFAGGFGATPGAFRFPAERSPIEVAKALIEAGADVNATRPNGDTALHGAAQAGNVALIRLLAENGAKLDAKNRFGLTPLDLAMGRQPASTAAGQAARGGEGGGRGGGRLQPQPAAIALLRELMGLSGDGAPQGNPQ